MKRSQFLAGAVVPLSYRFYVSSAVSFVIPIPSALPPMLSFSITMSTATCGPSRAGRVLPAVTDFTFGIRSDLRLVRGSGYTQAGCFCPGD